LGYRSLPRSEAERARQKTVRFLDELPHQPILSSKSKAWNGIVTEYRHHSPDEIASPPMAQHLITLNIASLMNFKQCALNVDTAERASHREVCCLQHGVYPQSVCFHHGIGR
jgi:hypothetical protein